jgi:hypothetical protein
MALVAKASLLWSMPVTMVWTGGEHASVCVSSKTVADNAQPKCLYQAASCPRNSCYHLGTTCPTLYSGHTTSWLKYSHIPYQPLCAQTTYLLLNIIVSTWLCACFSAGCQHTYTDVSRQHCKTHLLFAHCTTVAAIHTPYYTCQHTASP